MLASRTWLTDNSLLFIQLSVLIVEVWLSFKRHHMRFREWLFEPIWLIQRTWSRFVLFPCEIQKHWLYAMTELMEKSQSSSKVVCRSQMASTSNRQFKSNEDSWIENDSHPKSISGINAQALIKDSPIPWYDNFQVSGAVPEQFPWIWVGFFSKFLSCFLSWLLRRKNMTPAVRQEG